jgi:hypothetical protein
MSSTEHNSQDAMNGWEEIGRAAQDFARRVARDAGRFAERIEEHTGEFVRDLSRDWRRARRHARPCHRHEQRQAAPPDVRQVFEDIRGVIADVLDGIDELIERVFPETGASAETVWTRVVANRESTCSGCGAAIAAGAAAFVRRADQGIELRCATCGLPGGTPDDEPAA